MKEAFKLASTYKIKDSKENLEFVSHIQKRLDDQKKIFEEEYEKLRDLHYMCAGRLPYSPISKDSEFLNCLRLDYKEYRDGVISFPRLLKTLWFHAWEIRRNKCGSKY